MNTYINTKTFVKSSSKGIRSQRGALFGLDARLALAIFAGLSVVAGITLFDTIRQTDATALTSEFDTMAKATTNFFFDTNSAPGEFSELYEDGSPAIAGWNGPYITRSSDSHPKFGTYIVGRADYDDTDTAPATVTTSSSGDSLWLKLTNVSCEVVLKIDQQVDGVESGDDGGVNYAAPCSDADGGAGDDGDVIYLLARDI